MNVYSKRLAHFTANMTKSLLPPCGPLVSAVAVAVALVLPLGQVAAEPRIPAHASEVLDRLPMRPTDSTARELAALRAEVVQSAKASPANPDAAIRLAGQYFDLAMARGDPRYVGYADAVIKPFESEDSAPLWAMRGQLQQYRHGFSEALASFSAALKADPDFASAHAWRGAIFLVQADYGPAALECAALQRLGRVALSSGCSGLVNAYSGRLEAALVHFQQALLAASDPGNRLWLLTRMGEVQAWLGQPARAEAAYRQALALGMEDGYLLAAWNDFLLDQKRPAEVVQGLLAWESSDGLLLRLALAEKQLSLPKAAVHAQVLQDRFAAAKLRGDTTHRAEEARFLLGIKNDGAQALQIAGENYQVQREPRDARILLEAALAARDPVAAKPALEWLSRSGFADLHLRQTAKAIAQLPARGAP